MKLTRATLNDDAGTVVHAVDRHQHRTGGGKLEALCGLTPGGETTPMEKRCRSRWTPVFLGAFDSPSVNCEACVTKLAALGIAPDEVE